MNVFSRTIAEEKFRWKKLFSELDHLISHMKFNFSLRTIPPVPYLIFDFERRHFVLIDRINRSRSFSSDSFDRLLNGFNLFYQIIDSFCNSNRRPTSRPTGQPSNYRIFWNFFCGFLNGNQSYWIVSIRSEPHARAVQTCLIIISHSVF